LYYRLAATRTSWLESAREAYIAHAASSLGTRTLLTTEGFTVTCPDRAAGSEGLILEFIVRVSARRFPGGDDRHFAEAFFSQSDIALRLDGRPVKITAVELERAGQEGVNNFWSVKITTAAPGAVLRTGTELVFETRSATATFVLGAPIDEARPYQVPGVREFVRRLQPGDFDNRQSGF
jgi:hypothetical protein